MHTSQKEMGEPDPAGAEEAPRTYLKVYIIRCPKIQNEFLIDALLRDKLLFALKLLKLLKK